VSFSGPNGHLHERSINVSSVFSTFWRHRYMVWYGIVYLLCFNIYFNFLCKILWRAIIDIKWFSKLFLFLSFFLSTRIIVPVFNSCTRNTWRCVMNSLYDKKCLQPKASRAQNFNLTIWRAEFSEGGLQGRCLCVPLKEYYKLLLGFSRAARTSLFRIINHAKHVHCPSLLR
jgi:hypothetical protein